LDEAPLRYGALPWTRSNSRVLGSRPARSRSVLAPERVRPAWLGDRTVGSHRCRRSSRSKRTAATITRDVFDRRRIDARVAAGHRYQLPRLGGQRTGRKRPADDAIEVAVDRWTRRVVLVLDVRVPEQRLRRRPCLDDRSATPEQRLQGEQNDHPGAGQAAPGTRSGRSREMAESHEASLPCWKAVGPARN